MRQFSVLALFITFVCLCSTVSAQTTGPNQDIAGSWQGAFVIGQGKVRSILYVAPRGEAGYTGALIDLDSGDWLLGFLHGAADTGPINFADGKIAFEGKSAGIHFEGTVSPSGDEIKGKFTQGETSGDVIFAREAASSASIAEEYQPGIHDPHARWHPSPYDGVFSQETYRGSAFPDPPLAVRVWRHGMVYRPGICRPGA